MEKPKSTAWCVISITSELLFSIFTLFVFAYGLYLLFTSPSLFEPIVLLMLANIRTTLSVMKEDK